MFLIHALLRVFHRSWRPMVTTVVLFTTIAAAKIFSVVIYDWNSFNPQPTLEELSQISFMFVWVALGSCLFGLQVGICAKSVSFRSGEDYFNLDPLGLIGSLIGFLTGMYLASEHDTVLEVLDYELDAIMTGIIVGPLVGGFMGAILGEVFFPSAQPQSKHIASEAPTQINPPGWPGTWPGSDSESPTQINPPGD